MLAFVAWHASDMRIVEGADRKLGRFRADFLEDPLVAVQSAILVGYLGSLLFRISHQLQVAIEMDINLYM